MKCFCSDARSKSDPWTPDIHKKYPKRVWDVIVRTWRRQLHKYDLNAQSTLFHDSPLSSPSSSPTLNMSLSSEDDPTDYISDAIQRFQQEGEDDHHFEDELFLAPTPNMDSYPYPYESSMPSTQFMSSTPYSQSTPYSSFGISSMPEDSNSSMDSTTSSAPSFFSESMTSEYMSENSSDSWASIPLTPISLLGSPFASRMQNYSMVPTTTSSSTNGSTSSNGQAFLAPPCTPSGQQFQRGPRSASQHYQTPSTPTNSASSASQNAYSASQHSSPYGAIGAIPRFSLAAATTSTSANPFVPKLMAQDENMENSTLWNSR